MEKKYCYEYPRPAVTADCVVFGRCPEGIKLLLIERGADPYKGHWAFPGGFMNMDETADECARRELMEETGLLVDKVTQIGAYTAVDRDPRGRVMTVAFYAITDVSDVKGNDDAASAKWFPLDALPHLAFDHQTILEKALEMVKDLI